MSSLRSRIEQLEEIQRHASDRIVIDLSDDEDSDLRYEEWLDKLGNAGAGEQLFIIGS